MPLVVMVSMKNFELIIKTLVNRWSDDVLNTKERRTMSGYDQPTERALALIEIFGVLHHNDVLGFPFTYRCHLMFLYNKKKMTSLCTDLIKTRFSI